MDRQSTLVCENQNIDVRCSKLDVFYELDRLKTFASSPVPETKKDDLASLGFYYYKPDNVIKCAYCDLKILNFSNEDCINHLCPGKQDDFDDGVHDLQSSSEESSCSEYSADLDDILMMEKDAEQTLLDEIGIRGNIAPKCSDYKKYADRLKTFRKWSSLNQKPEVLCEAGFFFIGIDDRTACFHCGGGLKDWKLTDDPWIEHAHWFPNCRYVLNVKGENFTKNAWKTKIDRTSQQEVNNTAETLQNLLDVFNCTNHIKEKSDSSEGSSLLPLNSVNMVGTKDRSLTCQICFGGERDVLFSPCNHVVSCSSCATQLKRCVICRVVIKDIIRIFHS